jgi:hypothetical protein
MTDPRLVGRMLLAAMCASGCDSSSEIVPSAPPSGYPLAFVMHDCAPWDGPALAIVLSAHSPSGLEPVHPFARVMIYPRGEAMQGQVYRWPADPEMAAGNRCVAEGSCEMAAAGEVTLDAVRPDTAVEGRVRLQFAGGEEIAGGFRAVWLRRRVMCG